MLEPGDSAPETPPAAEPTAPPVAPPAAATEVPAAAPAPAPAPVPSPRAKRPVNPILLIQQLFDNAGSMDTAMGRLFTAVRSWALVPFALAICAGAGIWAFSRPALGPALEANKLPEIDRIWMGVWVGTTFLALAGIYLAVVLVRSRGHNSLRVTETASDLNKRFFPLLALPLFPALAIANVEKDSPKLTLFYIAAASFIIGRGVYAWSRPSNAPVSPAGDDAPVAASTWPKYVAATIVGALGVAYGAFFTHMAIVNHHALNSRTTDLGYYDNIFYQSAHGNPLGCSFIKAGYHGSAHFDPLLILLSPIYMLYPRAEFLLGLQSVWLGAGVVPVYLIAKAKLQRRLPAVLLAVMYVVYPALQGANMYEFHSLTLVTPIILWMLYFLETRNITGYWPAFAIALLTREDVSLLTCFIGAYAIVADRAKLARVGWVTIGVSLVYFVMVKRLFMTSADIFMSGKDAYSFAYYYDDLIPNHTGLGGMLLSLVTNPVFVLKTVFAEAKILYLLLLFLPLGFLPFVDRPGRIMLIYGLVFTLLASRAAVYSVHFQYSSLLLPIAFALTPGALRRIEDGPSAAFGLDGHRLSRALLGASLIASLLVAWKFGGITDNQYFKGGFSRVTRRLTPSQRETYAWIREQAASIPIGASVAVTNRLGPHVSNRMHAFFYPEKTRADYVFIDEAELKGNDLDKHHRAVKEGQLVQLARKDRLALFKRNVNNGSAPAVAPSAAPDTDPQRDREQGDRDREGE